MTPSEAKAKYEAEWPALNAAKEAATTPQAAKKCRQALSALSTQCAARFELDTPEPIELSCECKCKCFICTNMENEL